MSHTVSSSQTKEQLFQIALTEFQLSNNQNTGKLQLYKDCVEWDS